ncbi:SDR family NAD(P)-dependent oxidoreductase [Vibrio vulnificus]|uniref:SDR family NAD(P)-dependent oxidoreductase n=1 Tax=Vibrio vulnificus TaxID=672 RepID=UPI0009B5DFA4|nr:SDR family NAD(P)-dependent oxidoreductase [Vibrio vulnificus]OQK57770.1 Acetoacetyl-CoA reductase [Vibrio vulnificus]
MKSVLITGGTGGIGTALVKAFVNKGYHAYVTHTHKPRDVLDCWLAENKIEKKHVSFLALDLNNISEVELQISILLENSNIDVLINNAGVAADSTFLKMNLDQWNSVIDINLKSLFFVTQPIARSMVKNGFGRIINISSINGLKGQFGQCNYAAAKAGIIGFSKSLAQELATKGVSVNVIAPGYTMTPMVKNIREDILEKIKNNIPIKQLVLLEDLANTALMIAESGMSLTGETISVNGGQYMC